MGWVNRNFDRLKPKSGCRDRRSGRGGRILRCPDRNIGRAVPHSGWADPNCWRTDRNSRRADRNTGHTDPNFGRSDPNPGRRDPDSACAGRNTGCPEPNSGCTDRNPGWHDRNPRRTDRKTGHADLDSERAGLGYRRRCRTLGDAVPISSRCVRNSARFRSQFGSTHPKSRLTHPKLGLTRSIPGLTHPIPGLTRPIPRLTHPHSCGTLFVLHMSPTTSRAERADPTIERRTTGTRGKSRLESRRSDTIF